nr:hypothetical protein [uncultured Rhodopila sp.]
MVMIAAMAFAAAIATGDWKQRAGRLAQHVVADGFERIFLVGGRGPDAALCHHDGEMGVETGGDDQIDAVDRMNAGAPGFVERLLRRQVETRGFDRLRARLDIIDQEPAGAAGVPGHAAKVLAGNGDFHADLFLVPVGISTE